VPRGWGPASASSLAAFAGMIELDLCGLPLAIVAVGDAVASAHRVVDPRAGLRRDAAGAGQIGTAASIRNIDVAKLALGARQPANATARLSLGRSLGHHRQVKTRSQPA
jgi:hypothetical protein